MLTQTTITPYQSASEINISSGPIPLSKELAQELIGLSLDTNHMIPRGRSGKYIFPAKAQMDVLIAAYNKMISFSMFKAIDDLFIGKLNWVTHADLDQQVILRHTIERYEPVLGCVNVWWRIEMLDADSQSVLCSYQRRQRWYTA